MKKFSIFAAVFILAVVALPVFAYQTAIPDYVTLVDGNTVTVQEVQEFETYGDMMAGMKVTATYMDGDGVEAIWVGETDEYGFAHAYQDVGDEYPGKFREFQLSFTGDTYYMNWVLDEMYDGAITKLTIEALPGNTVFDVYDYGDAPDGVPNTPDSLRGYAFEYDTELYSDYTINATYKDLIAVGGNDAVGDLYGTLEITFNPAFVNPGTGSFAFKADTDIIVPVPEPGTVLLLGMGILGLLGYARKRK